MLSVPTEISLGFTVTLSVEELELFSIFNPVSSAKLMYLEPPVCLFNDTLDPVKLSFNPESSLWISTWGAWISIIVEFPVEDTLIPVLEVIVFVVILFPSTLVIVLSEPFISTLGVVIFTDFLSSRGVVIFTEVAPSISKAELLWDLILPVSYSSYKDLFLLSDVDPQICLVSVINFASWGTTKFPFESFSNILK